MKKDPDGEIHGSSFPMAGNAVWEKALKIKTHIASETTKILAVSKCLMGVAALFILAALNKDTKV